MRCRRGLWVKGKGLWGGAQGQGRAPCAVQPTGHPGFSGQEGQGGGWRVESGG